LSVSGEGTENKVKTRTGYPARPSAQGPADGWHQLAELILAESARAGLGPGARLPTERQLAADLGATRTSVRHALAVLEAGGHISREVGRGTFLRRAPVEAAYGGPAGRGPAQQAPGGRADGGVLDGGAAAGGAAAGGAAAGGAAAGGGVPGRPGAMARVAPVAAAAGPDRPGPGPAESTTGFAPADVMTIRRLLEPPAMPLVVAWATAADFREMERCLAGGGRAASYDEFETWDLALHRSIMAASHSPLLAQLYAVIEHARHGQSWGDLKRRSASRERRERYQADHVELVAALRARDSGRATEAMRAHLSRVGGDLFGETA
jgi:DNA-binding FadR family transcriptional regulator